MPRAPEMSKRPFSITSSSPWALSSVQPPRLAVSALGVHSDDQLAEIASFQHPDECFGRLLQTLDDILAVADAAVGSRCSSLCVRKHRRLLVRFGRWSAVGRSSTISAAMLSDTSRSPLLRPELGEAAGH